MLARRVGSTSMKATGCPSRRSVKQRSLTRPREKVALPAPMTAIFKGRAEPAWCCVSHLSFSLPSPIRPATAGGTGLELGGAGRNATPATWEAPVHVA